MSTVLSVDLGGTRMRAAVVDREGQVILRAEEPTPHDSACPDAFMSLLARVRDLGGGRGSFDSMVVGVPGRVDYWERRLEFAPNLPAGWVDDLAEVGHTVIGGGMGLNGDLVHEPVRDMLREYGPRDPARPIEVVAAGLGDDAGLIGGAAWELALGLT